MDIEALVKYADEPDTDNWLYIPKGEIKVNGIKR